jgi:phosphoserine aminotransferase
VKSRVYNFSAGPAALPLPVLETIQSELLDWKGVGVSMLELNHRSDHFAEVMEKSERDLRELMGISDDYRVLFLAGGARVQFSLIPMNILGQKNTADYVDTGFWSQVAWKEAEHYCTVNVVASGATDEYRSIPSRSTWRLNSEAAYLHYTANETIGGVEFHSIPEGIEVPLCVDMTSNILAYPVDVSRFGILYAGIAGLTIVIVRKDLLEKATLTTPMAFNYTLQDKHKSILITAPTFAWYVAGLVFDWVKQQGGLSAMALINERKAALIYSVIDRYPDFYRNVIHTSCRSRMNIPFTLPDKILEEKFLKAAEAENFYYLKGHAVSGGIRVTLYNAISEKITMLLAAFMEDFAERFGKISK